MKALGGKFISILKHAFFISFTALFSSKIRSPCVKGFPSQKKKSQIGITRLITVLVFVLAYYTVAECKILTKPKPLEQLCTTFISGGCANLNFLTQYPVKIWVRIVPPRPLVSVS
jgi:hypothetical protein